MAKASGNEGTPWDVAAGVRAPSQRAFTKATIVSTSSRSAACLRADPVRAAPSSTPWQWDQHERRGSKRHSLQTGTCNVGRLIAGLPVASHASLQVSTVVPYLVLQTIPPGRASRQADVICANADAAHASRRITGQGTAGVASPRSKLLASRPRILGCVEATHLRTRHDSRCRAAETRWGSAATMAAACRSNAHSILCMPSKRGPCSKVSDMGAAFIPPSSGPLLEFFKRFCHIIRSLTAVHPNSVGPQRDGAECKRCESGHKDMRERWCCD